MEFAFAAPFMFGLCCYGLELGQLALTRMRMSQAAMTVADNMSRVGQTNNLNVTSIREVDVVDSFIEAQQETPDIFNNGRVVISSLQQNASGGQWIAWQRCRGSKAVNSQFGLQGTGSTGTSFQGMGPTGSVVQAPTGSAGRYVEVFYDFQPLFPLFWSANPPTNGSFFFSPIFNNSTKAVKYNAAYIVRDRRQLAVNDTNGNIQNGQTGITNPQNPLTGQTAPVMGC